MRNKMFPEEYKNNMIERVLKLKERERDDGLREIERYSVEAADGTVSGELRLVRIPGEHST
jgi:hypothetical protein